MRRYIYVIMLLFAIFGLNSEVLSLDKVIQLAIEHNNSLQQSKLSILQKKSELNESRYNLLPDLTISSNLELVDFEGTELSNSLQLSLEKGISLNDAKLFQNISSFHNLNIAEINYLKQENDVIYNVITHYVNIKKSEKKIILLYKNLALQEKIVTDNVELNKSGKITDYSLQQSKINLLNSRISLLKEKNTLQDRRRELFNVINQEDNQEQLSPLSFEITTSLPKLETTTNFDLKINEINQAKLKSQLLEEKLSLFPKTTLSYSYEKRNLGSDWNFSKNNSTVNTLGLRFSYSLTDLFTTSERKKQVKYSLKDIELSHEEKVKELEKEYNNLTSEVDYLLEMDELLSDKLKQAKLNLDNAKEKSSLGLISQLELNDTIYQATDAEINEIDNKYSLYLKIIQIKHLLSQNLR